jgi:hypothetical protein
VSHRWTLRRCVYACKASVGDAWMGPLDEAVNGVSGEVGYGLAARGSVGMGGLEGGSGSDGRWTDIGVVVCVICVVCWAMGCSSTAGSVNDAQRRRQMLKRRA